MLIFTWENLLERFCHNGAGNDMAGGMSAARRKPVATVLGAYRVPHLDRELREWNHDVLGALYRIEVRTFTHI